jgi:hypothetical protein
MFYDTDGNLQTNIEATLERSAVRDFTFDIDCVSGHTLSCEPVAGLVVEARQGIVGAWTNIEIDPIDLTPYAGTQETFQFRVTAPAADLIAAFRFRTGPAQPQTYYLTYLGDQLTYLGDPLTYTT